MEGRHQRRMGEPMERSRRRRWRRLGRVTPTGLRPLARHGSCLDRATMLSGVVEGGPVWEVTGGSGGVVCAFPIIRYAVGKAERWTRSVGGAGC